MSALSHLTVEDLSIEVRWSAHRKTVELTVERDGALTVRAPEGTAPSAVEGFVREKLFWVYTKLAEKEALRHPVPTREYVTGEGFRYLGRSHRLLLVESQDVPLKLEAGRFKLLRSEASRGREHFVAWYKVHALPWLRRRVAQWAPRIGVQPKSLEVRDLGYRWGSCGHSGGLNFHWQTILLPPGMVDYVVVHELVHLKEPNHTAEFWTQVERVLPDQAQRKAWLASNGAACAGL